MLATFGLEWREAGCSETVLRNCSASVSELAWTDWANLALRSLVDKATWVNGEDRISSPYVLGSRE